MKKIGFMLDLQRTLDGLSKANSEILFDYLEEYKNKFNADEIVIFLSTSNDLYSLKYALSILAESLPENIKIGKSFCYEGEYDYYSDTLSKDETIKNYPAKMETLKANYFKEDYVFICVIDDNFDLMELLPYRDTRALTLLSPSNNQTYNRGITHFTTTEYAYEGLLNLLKKYLENIKDLSYEEIIEKQIKKPIILDEKLKIEPFFQRYVYKLNDLILLNKFDSEDMDEFNRIYNFIKEIENVPEDIITYLDDAKECLDQDYSSKKNNYVPED